VAALPDQEGVRSHICTYRLKGVSEVVLSIAKRHTAVIAIALAVAITVVK
jgi:VanZ family protein